MTYRWFRDDTGSDLPILSTRDINDIQSMASWLRPDPVEYGYVYIESISGSVVGWVVGLEMVLTMRPHPQVEPSLLRNPSAMTSPVLVPVAVMPPGHFEGLGRHVRLTSGWWRDLVYQARAPDNSGDMIVSTDKASLVDQLPDVNPLEARAREPRIPRSMFSLPTIIIHCSHLNRSPHA